MEQDGHLKSLAERMKEKAEQERIQTENVFREQLRTLSDSLRESSKNALRTMSDAITADIERATASLSQHYRILSIAYGRAWMRTAITALAVLAPLTLMAMALSAWMRYQVTNYHNTLDRLDVKIAAQEQTLANLNAQTWGVTFKETEHGRFIILPAGVSPGQTYIMDMRKAIRMER